MEPENRQFKLILIQYLINEILEILEKNFTISSKVLITQFPNRCHG